MATIDDCVVDSSGGVGNSFLIRLCRAGGEGVSEHGVACQREIGQHREVEKPGDIDCQVDRAGVSRLGQGGSQVGHVARIVAVGRSIENAAPGRDLTECSTQCDLVHCGGCVIGVDDDGITRGDPQRGADEHRSENDDNEPLAGGEVHTVDGNGQSEVHGRAVRVEVVGR